MTTVTLIGGDGAGKTSIAQKLLEISPFPIKYIYMGMNSRSSQYSLPTSRLVFHLKKRSYKNEVSDLKGANVDDIPAQYLEYNPRNRGFIWTSLRLFNRLLEAWYRQCVAIYYQLGGYMVIFDRHPLFDTVPFKDIPGMKKTSKLTRINHWIFQHFFPKPDLIIFLDAPAEILHARKIEATLNYLRRQREAFLAKCEKSKNFMIVDATQSFEKVLADVQEILLEFHTKALETAK